MAVRYSPVAPIRILEQLQKRHLIDGYLLVLTHEVLEHRHRYNELVFAIRESYGIDDAMIILDNGVIEKGKPASIEATLEAASIVEPDCIVAPDMLGDYKGTQMLCMKHGDTIAREFPLMLVPQGSSFVELTLCADWLASRFQQNGTPLYWGIPRWIADDFGTRLGIINYITNYHSPCKIHLLGMSGVPEDDWTSLRSMHIMGIDSANPLVLAYNGHPMQYNYMHMQRDDFWETAELDDEIAHNIDWTHDIVSKI